MKRSELCAYIANQESVIQAQSKTIQQLSNALALHEALKEQGAAE
jgi:hypothetical protein